MHIDNYSFGMFVVDGRTYESDIKLIGNEIKLWRNHHLCLDDVKDAVSAKPKTIIIGTGSAGVVEVNSEISDFIKKNKIKLIIAKTVQACRIYNELNKKGEKVAAILHSTC